jgi:hypothetical protein
LIERLRNSSGSFATLAAANRHTAAEKLQNVIAVTEAPSGSGISMVSEDDKSASAGVGFRKGNLRPHSTLGMPKIADPRVCNNL